MARTPPPGPGAPPGTPPEARGPLVRLARLAVRPLERFLRIEAASGIVLLAAAAVALAWANSPWAASYHALWATPVGIRVGAFAFERSLSWLVNDGLMVIFFFVVGMEIRSEVHHGELSEWRRAALPAAAALGGMIAPAAIYLALAGAPEARPGWGVPMATDIAFAVGVLALLGRRVPSGLRVLLLALAVIDDLGAIVVIALFYTAGVAVPGLLVAALAVAAIFAMQAVGIRSRLAYVAPGVVAWAGIYAAGIHPTIAGVVLGLVTPVRAWFGPGGFVAGAGPELERLATAEPGSLSPREVAAALRGIDAARREAVSPAQGLIDLLHPWVAFGIMPVFALANAGVTVPGGSLDPSSWHVASGVVLGLVAGKPIGVLAACGLAVALRIGSLPAGIGLRHLVVLGVVAGVGFTMALFIAGLAFGEGPFLDAAKLGVLSASAVAALLGLALGRLLLKPPAAGGAGSG
jgi:NhaA family Na+:H+ antiporter